MATTRTTNRPRTLRRIESIDAAATVRHVDQLDERTLDAFYGALNGISSGASLDIEPGTVVVASGYYRVEGV
jgi:hypothetical protein